jgi:hypothetical protein
MKTGLFRDSFLEDPWKDLIPRRTGLRATGVDVPLPVPSYSVGRSVERDPLRTKGEAHENEGGLDDVDGEGEIMLPDSDEEDTSQIAADSGIGLGDGLVEAARRV